ncbi:hypothetical protein HYY69_06005 [Candidatus Woesearchaeota archaeon]|nr:hypothetical protein [Candidatus Woesearchaeota archaeon]
MDVVKDEGHYSVIGSVQLPLKLLNGTIVHFMHYGFRFNDQHYGVLLYGDSNSFSSSDILVRISSNCQWSFYFDNQYCDCRWQLEMAKLKIVQEGKGIIIFCHDHHGKGVGIENHWKVYTEGQKRGCELVVDAYTSLGFKEDYRDYTDVISILHHYNIKNIRLLSNSPQRKKFFEEHGFIVILENIEEPIHDNLKEEYSAKKHKLGHLLLFSDEKLI